MNKYLIEATGTFFLVLTIALTGNPLAIGAILIAMIYMGGYISGAHYNPAVTLAVYVRGKIKKDEAIRYMVSQFLGGLIAAAVFSMIQTQMFTPAPTSETSFFSIFLIELLFTFALGSVVLHVATSDKVKDNYYYGIAIGLTIMAAAYAGGPISGGVYNPAVALGPIIFNIGEIGTNINNLIVYLVATFSGGALAGLFFNHTSEEKRSIFSKWN